MKLRGRPVSQADLHLIWQHACAIPGTQGALSRALIALMVGSGLRCDEIVNVRTTGYDETELQTSTHTVPIDEWMRKSLDPWFEERKRLGNEAKNLFIVPRAPREPLISTSLWFRIVMPALPMQVRGRISPHDFRRTFCDRLLAKGFLPGEVQYLLGLSHEKLDEKSLFDRRRATIVYQDPPVFTVNTQTSKVERVIELGEEFMIDATKLDPRLFEDTPTAPRRGRRVGNGSGGLVG